MNPFIDAEAGVDGDASNDEGSEDKNDDLDGFIVADDIEFLITYNFFYIKNYFIVLVHNISHILPLYICHAFIFLN